MWEEAVYAKPASVNSGATRLSVGQPFMTFDDVDFLFAQLPQAVKFRDGSPIKKTRVSILPLDAEQIMTAPDNLVGIGDRLTIGRGSSESQFQRRGTAASLSSRPASSMASSKAHTRISGRPRYSCEGVLTAGLNRRRRALVLLHA